MKDVVADKEVYSDAYFFPSVTAGEIAVRLSTEVTHLDTAVTADVVGVSVESDSGQSYAVDKEVSDVRCAREEVKTVLAS